MGHCRRFEAISPYFPADCRLAVVGMDGPPSIESSIESSVDNLSRPVECVSVPGFGSASKLSFMQQQTAHDYHGLLVNHGQNTAFVLAMVSFFSRWQPDLLVVDVGLEASILARMCGIPTLYVRQHGHRWDKGHCLAYEWAGALLAPFAAEMEQPDCPNWIQKKTFYSGGFSRFSSSSSGLSSTLCKRAEAPASYAKTKPNILVMTGFGGTTITPQKISAAAAATPDWQWHYLGSSLDMPGVCSEGVVENVWPYLSHADLVIANAGHNSVMEIAAAGTPAIFIPAERPFAEQICKAQTLTRLNLGIVVESWPADSQWYALKRKAQSQDLSQWKRLQDGGAAQRAAEFITQIAERCMTTDK